MEKTSSNKPRFMDSKRYVSPKVIEAAIDEATQRRYQGGATSRRGLVTGPCARCGSRSLDATLADDVHCVVCGHRQGASVKMPTSAVSGKGYTQMRESRKPLLYGGPQAEAGRQPGVRQVGGRL